MQTPRQNVAGHVVLLHSGTDDNLHLQNTMQLSASKQNVELIVYRARASTWTAWSARRARTSNGFG
jgi:hypothetical protein